MEKVDDLERYFLSVQERTQRQNARFEAQEIQRKKRQERELKKSLKSRATPFLYCISDIDLTVVKFGFSDDIEQRFKALQMNNHLTLRLDAKLTCVMSFEKGLHRALAPYRLRGEWYRPFPEILRIRDFMMGEGAQAHLNLWMVANGHPIAKAEEKDTAADPYWVRYPSWHLPINVRSFLSALGIEACDGMA